MEKVSESSAFSSELIAFFLLEIIFSTFNRFRKQSTRFLSLFSPSPRIQVEQTAPRRQNRGEERAEEELIIGREDARMVMEGMGLIGHDGGEALKEFLGPEEVAAMFEEEEPSMEELREAFSFFDENGDGFVDALELQRVLCRMGFANRAVGLDSCVEMIKPHDENGDGKVDFGEFVKLVENSFC